MIPVIAIVGRPNVGKSTLFNCLTRSRDALVLDMPGVTRDRQYGECAVGDVPAIIIDTGGMVDSPDGVETLMNQQVRAAIQECDEILFVVDAQSGLTAQDEQCAQLLRQQHKKVHLCVNKTDGRDPTIAVADFYALGMGEPIPLSAAHRRGITSLVEEILVPYSDIQKPELPEKSIKIAVVGKPNVGKSTLINRLLGEERVVVFDAPGTTRDSIYIPFERRGVHYTFIDTAGVRRRAKVDEVLEKFSVVKSLKAIEDAHVVLLLIDATENITEQDLKLLSFIVDAGRSMVVVVNKWDGLDADTKTSVQEELDRRLPFLDYVKFHYISALHGSGVGALYPLIEKAYASATKDLATPELTRILEQAIAKYQPPLVKGRRVKCRYAHAGGQCPPVIVIHGNQVSKLPPSYQRYLQKTFREALQMEGTPIRLQFKEGDNPYKDKKNTLTDRQKKKKKRLMRHVKK